MFRTDKATKVLLTVGVIFLVSVALVHVYLMGFDIYLDQFYTFWLPVVALGLVVFFSAVHFKSRFPLLLIILFALGLHLVPFVRQPQNMIWNPDGIYELQLVNHVNLTGHWSFGYGTGQASGYSFYPVLGIFASVLSSVTSLSSLILIQYSMAFIDLLTLLTFYVLIDGLFKLDFRTKNLMLFFFALNPAWNSLDGYFIAESYAIILFPLILLYILQPKNSSLLKRREPNHSLSRDIIAVFLLVTVTMTHPFTSYMIIVSLLVPLMLMFLVYRESFARRNLVLLAVVLPLAWLSLVAGSIFTYHTESLMSVFKALTSAQSLVGYNFRAGGSSLAYYPSAFSTQLTLLRNILIVAIPMAGLLWYSRIKEKTLHRYFKFLLLFLLGSTIVLLYFVNWPSTLLPDVRQRILTFAYFPIAFFFPLGLEVMAGWIGRINQKYLKHKAPLTWKFFMKPSAIILLTIVMVVPTVLTAFPRFMYDTTYQSVSISDFQVAVQQRYSLGTWVSLHVNPQSSTIEFAGSPTTESYVLGYGLFQGLYLGKLNETQLSTQLASLPQHSVYYVLNALNIQTTDSLGTTINSSTVEYLNTHYCRVYDNGPIILFDCHR